MNPAQDILRRTRDYDSGNVLVKISAYWTSLAGGVVTTNMFNGIKVLFWNEKMFEINILIHGRGKGLLLKKKKQIYLFLNLKL